MADVIVDTSALLAYFDTSEPDHSTVSEAIDALTGLLVVSPYVVAELDYLVATRHGVDAELAVLDELTGGAWELAGFGAEELTRGATRSSRSTEARRSVWPMLPMWCWPSGTAPVPS